VRRRKARKPATDSTVNGLAVSQAGELRSRKLHQDDYAFQLAVYDGTQHIGYVIARVNAFTAYDVAGRRLGKFPSQRRAVRSIPVVRP
jgi:hypothetical protein